MRKTYWIALTLACAFLLPAAKAGSLTDPFSGSFTFDNDVIKFQVDLPVEETLAVYTTSAASGGFAPYLVMWFGDGTPLTQFSGGEPTCSLGYSTPRPGVGCNDTYIAEDLPAGTYYVGLAQTNNFATGGLDDPFVEDGVDNQNYTNSPPYSACVGGPGYFCDGWTLSSDSPNWSVSFTATSVNGDAAETVTELTPEPATAWILLGGLGVLGAARRKLRR